MHWLTHSGDPELRCTLGDPRLEEGLVGIRLLAGGEGTSNVLGRNFWLLEQRRTRACLISSRVFRESESSGKSTRGPSLCVFTFSSAHRGESNLGRKAVGVKVQAATQLCWGSICASACVCLSSELFVVVKVMVVLTFSSWQTNDGRI